MRYDEIMDRTQGNMTPAELGKLEIFRLIDCGELVVAILSKDDVGVPKKELLLSSPK